MDTKQLVHIDQMIDVEELIEEIEFHWVVGLIHAGNAEKAIPLSIISHILTKHFPQIQTYIDGRLQ